MISKDLKLEKGLQFCTYQKCRCQSFQEELQHEFATNHAIKFIAPSALDVLKMYILKHSFAEFEIAKIFVAAIPFFINYSNLLEPLYEDVRKTRSAASQQFYNGCLIKSRENGLYEPKENVT